MGVSKEKNEKKGMRVAGGGGYETGGGKWFKLGEKRLRNRKLINGAGRRV